MTIRSARGIGIANLDAEGLPLDVWFPAPELTDGGRPSDVRHLSPADAEQRLGPEMAGMAGRDEIRDVTRVAVDVIVGDLHAPIASIYDVFLRLHLLSHRLVQPNALSLAGLLETLRHDVGWTSLGPCRADRLPRALAHARAARIPLHVGGIFPTPPMLDYVQPSHVTIADSARVLLGAHLAPGTVVTPEGFCGLNAGTLGPCMIEGRISAGVMVDTGTDIGGGASIMGVMSGGGRHVVRIGKRCLVGANAGVGISLGDDCLVEAGCYVTAGSLVALPNGQTVKARELAGRPGLIFRRHSQTGTLEAIENKGRWDGLNLLLHPATH